MYHGYDTWYTVPTSQETVRVILGSELEHSKQQILSRE